MGINKAIKEWNSKKRRMGCVNAANWFTTRVKGFKTVHLDRYTQYGEYYRHTVVTNGVIIIDLTPYADRPSKYAFKAT